MAQDGEGLRSLVFANPTGILIKGDIEDPMEGVLDAPVLPYRLGEPHALRWQGSQKIPRLDLDRVPHFTTCLDHPHAVQVGPRGLGAKRLCTKSPVRNLTHGSIGTFWSHSESFSRPDRPIFSIKSIAKEHFWCKAALGEDG